MALAYAGVALSTAASLLCYHSFVYMYTVNLGFFGFITPTNVCGELLQQCLEACGAQQRLGLLATAHGVEMLEHHFRLY